MQSKCYAIVMCYAVTLSTGIMTQFEIIYYWPHDRDFHISSNHNHSKEKHTFLQYLTALLMHEVL